MPRTRANPANRRIIPVDTTVSGLDRLRLEIANRAFEDYLYALNGRVIEKRAGFEYTPETMIRDCEKFFRSVWFRRLYHLEIDGEVIISELRQRAEEGQERYGRAEKHC